MSTLLGPFRAIDHHFSITVDGDPGVDVGEVFAGLADADATPESRYRVVMPPEPTVSDDGDRVVIGDLFDGDDLIASGNTRVLLQMLIARLAVRTSERPGPAFHASTVGDERGAVLLVGPSRRGKSTFSARLLMDGLALVAEDISAIDPPTGLVRPYHRPLGLSEASFKALGVDIPPAAGAPCGCGGKVLIADSHLGFSYREAVPVKVVAFVDHERDDLVAVTPGRMLSDMLTEGVMVMTEAPDAVEALIDLVARSRCVHLGTGDLEQAADWIDQLLDRAEPPTVPWFVQTRGDVTDLFVGSEAVVVGDGTAHHLNQSAAAIHLLATEGEGADDIARELGLSVEEVETTLVALG